MGFKCFWTIANANDSGVEHSAAMVFDFTDSPFSPWIVIDWNNLVMNCSSTDGGFSEIMVERVTSLFAAIFRSGAKICIVRDGGFDSDRLLIKLQRTFDNLIQCITPELARNCWREKMLQSREMLRSASFEAAQIQCHLYAHRVPCSSNLADPNAAFIDVTAPEEADDKIREFCAAKVNDGEPVYIFSGDASLILNVPEANLLHMVDLKSLAVENTVLCGRVVNVQTVYDRMNTLADRILRQPPLTYKHIPHVIALLETEQAEFVDGQFFDPMKLIKFMKECLLPRNKRDRNLDKVLTSIIITRALIKTTKGVIVAGTYERLIKSIVDIAKQVYDSRNPPSRPSMVIFNELRVCEDVTCGSLKVFADGILQSFEFKAVNELQNATAVDKHGFGTCHAMFLGQYGPYRATYRTSRNAANCSVWFDNQLESSTRQPAYNMPCGLTPIAAQQRMVHEIIHRINATTGVITDSSLLLWQKLVFGKWINYEARDQEIELELLPLTSLREQVKTIKALKDKGDIDVILSELATTHDPIYEFETWFKALQQLNDSLVTATSASTTADGQIISFKSTIITSKVIITESNRHLVKDFSDLFSTTAMSLHERREFFKQEMIIVANKDPKKSTFGLWIAPFQPDDIWGGGRYRSYQLPDNSSHSSSSAQSVFTASTSLASASAVDDQNYEDFVQKGSLLTISGRGTILSTILSSAEASSSATTFLRQLWTMTISTADEVDMLLTQLHDFLIACVPSEIPELQEAVLGSDPTAVAALILALFYCINKLVVRNKNIIKLLIEAVLSSILIAAQIKMNTAVAFDTNSKTGKELEALIQAKVKAVYVKPTRENKLSRIDGQCDVVDIVLDQLLFISRVLEDRPWFTSSLSKWYCQIAVYGILKLRGPGKVDSLHNAILELLKDLGMEGFAGTGRVDVMAATATLQLAVDKAVEVLDAMK